MDNAAAEMPRYVCHKKVCALKIKMVELGETASNLGGQEVVTDVVLHFEDSRYAPKSVSISKKPTPQAGWYYVVYDSPTNPGYFSFSPAPEFESGYTLESELQAKTKIVP